MDNINKTIQNNIETIDDNYLYKYVDKYLNKYEVEEISTIELLLKLQNIKTYLSIEIINL